FLLHDALPIFAAFAVNSISTCETHALLRIGLSVLVLAGVIAILVRPYRDLDAAGLAPSPTALTTAVALTAVFAVGTLFASTMGSLWLSVVAAQALWLAVTCLAWRPLAGRSEFIVITAFLTMMRSEEHTSEPSHVSISYAVFCLKK